MSDRMVRKCVRGGHLGGQRNDDDDSIKTTVLQWLPLQAANFYDEGIKNLVVRYDKCLNIGGNYVEKYIKVQAFI